MQFELPYLDYNLQRTGSAAWSHFKQLIPLAFLLSLIVQIQYYFINQVVTHWYVMQFCNGQALWLAIYYLSKLLCICVVLLGAASSSVSYFSFEVSLIVQVIYTREDFTALTKLSLIV